MRKGKLFEKNIIKEGGIECWLETEDKVMLVGRREGREEEKERKVCRKRAKERKRKESW
jgi:hypothetical protein